MSASKKKSKVAKAARPKSRKDVRLIDLVTTDDYENHDRIPSDYVKDLAQHWLLMEDKGWDLVEKLEQHDSDSYEAAENALLEREGKTRAWLREQHRNGKSSELLGDGIYTDPTFATDVFSVRELAAMFRVVSCLMAQLDSDSARRSSRDHLVAADYVLHDEFMHEKNVNKGVQQRWNISRAAVDQARNSVPQMRDLLIEEKNDWAEHGRIMAIVDIRGHLKYGNPSDLNYKRTVKLIEGMTEDEEISFEKWKAHWLASIAAEYLAGKMPDYVPRKR